MDDEQVPTVLSRGQRQGRMRHLTRHMLAQFRDGEFHLLCDIATAMQVDVPAMRDICDRIVRRGPYDTYGERRPAPRAQGSFAYRFVKGGKKINLVVFYAEVQPILDDMERVIHGHSVDFSQQAMQMAFARFRKVIDRVAR